MFFLAEMNESNSVITPGSSTSSAAVAAGPATDGGAAAGGGDDDRFRGAELDVRSGDPEAADAEEATGSLPGGLRRFASFEEYVVSGGGNCPIASFPISPSERSGLKLAWRQTSAFSSRLPPLLILSPTHVGDAPSYTEEFMCGLLI